MSTDLSSTVTIEVAAGVVRDTPDLGFTRRWTITTDEWHEAAGGEPNQMSLLAKRAGEAEAYAHVLMLQPERFNWVRMIWHWGPTADTKAAAPPGTGTPGGPPPRRHPNPDDSGPP